MPTNDPIQAWVRDPLAWAADCRAQAHMAPEPEAQAAFHQLADEFEDTASEIDGLVSSYEALVRSKRLKALYAEHHATAPGRDGTRTGVTITSTAGGTPP